MKRIALVGVLAFLWILPSKAQEYVPNEIIVKYRSQGSGKGLSQDGPLSRLKAQQKVGVAESYSRFNMEKLSLKAGAKIEDIIDEIKTDPEVEYAEPNFYLSKLEMPSSQTIRLSRDNYISSLQSDTYQAESYFQQGHIDTGIREAWVNSSTLGEVPEKIVVAVIDTGVDIDHELFVETDAIWQNEAEVYGHAGVDDDNNGFVDDFHGWNFFANNNNPDDDDSHGTHVAGIVLGATQNIFRIDVEESKVKIMALKFLGANGTGTTSGAIKAIHYAVDNGAHILNNSWGGPHYSAALHEALAYSYDNETLFVAAAGNYGKDNDVSPIYPASYDTPNILSVAASTDWDTIAGFSNYGLRSVHIAAPGVGIWSTLPNDQVGSLTGTSMAAPFAAGVAALVLRESLSLTGYQMKHAIMDGVDRISEMGNTIITGGRINALNSLGIGLSEYGSTSYQPDYTLKLSSGYKSRTISSDAGAGGCGLVKNVYDQAVREGRSGFQGPSAGAWGLVFVLLIAPVLIWQGLRSRQTSSRDNRRHDRYKIASEIKLSVGGKELVGNMSTISLGGCSFNTDALLEKGGVINMQISSPDGKEVLEVQGQVVWCAEREAYGVKFAEDLGNGRLQTFNQWTQNLMKT